MKTMKLFSRIKTAHTTPTTIIKGWPSVPIAGGAYESDNIASAAKPIANGQTQRRTTHAAGKVDWAKFTVGVLAREMLGINLRHKLQLGGMDLEMDG